MNKEAIFGDPLPPTDRRLTKPIRTGYPYAYFNLRAENLSDLPPQRLTQTVVDFLHTHPYIGQELETVDKAHRLKTGRNQDHITMAVAHREHPYGNASQLVITKTAADYSFVVPTLLCTQGAIKDLFIDKVPYGQYAIVTSSFGELLDFMRDCQDTYLFYDPKRTTPEDYIALAATGFFGNEKTSMPILL